MEKIFLLCSFDDNDDKAIITLLITHPYTSDKDDDSHDQHLPLQKIHETYPSVVKQSLNVSFSDPFFWPKYWLFFSPDIPLHIETILIYQKRDPVLEIVYKRITKISRPMIITLIITASLFLMENYRFFHILYIDEHYGLITFKNQLLKKMINFRPHWW